MKAIPNILTGLFVTVFLTATISAQSPFKADRSAETSDEPCARAFRKIQAEQMERAKIAREQIARKLGGMSGIPRPPSALASSEEKELYRAWETTKAIERGEATLADLPEEYGGRPTGTSRRAVEARKVWDITQAIQMENALTSEGAVSEAAALRLMRLQEEGNESLERLHRAVEQIKTDLWLRGRW